MSVPTIDLKELHEKLFAGVEIPAELQIYKAKLERMFGVIAKNALDICNDNFEKGANYVMDRLEPKLTELSETASEMKESAQWEMDDIKRELYKLPTENEQNAESSN